MEGDLIKIREWLLPIAWLYGIGVRIRNWLFDTNILKSKSYDIPVISVGNITVGGTGKTPHTEYLIRLLEKRVKVAVLSRGYKRKSKGFVLATADTPMQDIGDEPFQMKEKFPNIYVAVDKDRRHGIEKLCDGQTAPGTGVVLLDDAFQHRYVKPGLNILLVDYHRLICDDKLLPAGRLREPQAGKDRANIVIVTKCPPDIKPMGFRVIKKNLKLFPYQALYFSTEIRQPESLVRNRHPPARQFETPRETPAPHRHSLTGTNENGPRTSWRRHRPAHIQRPSRLHARRRETHQRDLCEPGRKPHRDHRKRRRPPENPSRTKRKGQESTFRAARGN